MTARETRERRGGATRAPSPAGDGAYDAFISYSHAVDGRLAPALQSGLQGLGKPWYRRRALRVFRDQTSLSASPELWPSIERALSSSRYFVLLASPEAAASRWVDAEVAWWRANRDSSTCLIALTGGDLAWEESTSDFGRQASVPAAMRGWFAVEPLWVDLRWARDELHVSARNPRFRDALADLAAPLRGIPKDELVGEDIRQHRRTLAIVRLAVSMLVALTIAAAAGAVLAVDQRNTARSQRDRAERETRIAVSRSLADAAVEQLGVKRDLGVLLALASLHIAPTVEARDAVVRAVQQTARIERTLADDPDGVADLAVRPESSIVATVGADIDSPARVWDASSGTLRRVLKVGTPAPVDVSRDGLVAVGEEVWDSERGRRVARLSDAVDSDVVDVAFARDGTRLAVAHANGTISVWDVATRRRRWTLRAGIDELTATSLSGVGRVAFGRDDRSIVFGGADGTISAWRLEGRRPTRTVVGRHGEAVIALALAPRAPLVATAAFTDEFDFSGWSAPSTIRLWNYETGEGLGPVRSSPSVTALAFATDGAVLASGGAGGVKLWSAGPDAMRLLETLGTRSESITSLAFAPTSGELIAGGDDGKVVVWNRAPSAAFGERLDLGGPADRVALSPGGRVLAVGGLGRVRFWSVASKTPLTAWLDGHVANDVTDLEFDPTGTVLASSASDHAVRLWDVAGRRTIGAPLVPPSSDDLTYAEVTPLAFSPDGSVVASAASEDAVIFWNVRTRAAVGRLRDLSGDGFTSVAFAPDGSTVAVGTRNGEISFWDTERRRRLGSSLRARGLEGFSFIHALAFSPDGRLLASGGDDNVVRLWDVAARRQVGEPLRGHRSTVRYVAFAPSGGTLASGDEDGAVRLWDPSRQRALGEPLQSGGDAVTGLAFSADGRTLAAVTGGPKAVFWNSVLWPVDAEQAAERLCRVAGRDLTPAEWSAYVAFTSSEKLCGGTPTP